MCLYSDIFQRNINPVAPSYDVFRGKAEISNGLPCVCTVTFSWCSKQLFVYHGYRFQRVLFSGVCFVIVSFPFSISDKEGSYSWHIESGPSFLRAVLWFGISFEFLGSVQLLAPTLSIHAAR
jgi:hypothetical protein